MLALVSCGPDLRGTGGFGWGIAHDVIVDANKYDVSDAPHGVRGVRVLGAISWIVPVEGGVVLVDTGFDESGEILRQALGDQRVRAILLTHSHLDHISGSHLYGDIPVYIHRDDYGAMFVAGQNGVPGIQLIELLLGRPPVPTGLREIYDGDELWIGGEPFTAAHLPGHTPGSTSFLFRDLLFSGDALTVVPTEGSALGFEPCPDYPEASCGHFNRLKQLELEAILDGHWGITEGPASALDDALEVCSSF